MQIIKLMMLIEDETFGNFHMIDNESGSEIRYSKDEDSEGPKGWGWRIISIGKYEEFSTKNVADLVMEKRITVPLFEYELANNVADLAYYHKHRLREIRKTLNTQLASENFSTAFLREADVVARRSTIRLVRDNT